MNFDNDKDFEPYDKPVTSFKILQLSAGQWVELIRMPLEASEEQPTPKQIQDALEALRRMIYKTEKVYIDVQGECLCLKGLDEGPTTFKVVAAFD